MENPIPYHLLYELREGYLEERKEIVLKINKKLFQHVFMDCKHRLE